MKTNTSSLVQILAVLIFAVGLIIAALYYQDLPESIPQHFNMQGEADAKGHKQIIWAISGISLLLLLIIFIAIKNVRHLNLGEPDNEEPNAASQERMKLVLSWISLISSLVFSLITCYTIQEALDGSGASYISYLPLILLMALSFVYPVLKKSFY